MLAEADEYPESHKIAPQLGYRTALAVPLVHAGEAIGVIFIRRTEVRPFTERQIELVETFADQAVIAIENTRLFEEVQARNTELRVALEQQTATSEVLSVISRSSGEVQPVFEIMLANATKLCEATYGAMWIREENGFRNAAFHGRPWRNPRIGSTYPSGDWGWRNPITDIAGCARPVIGHATAPPTSVMNSRRLMRPPSIYADATRVSDLTGALK